MSQSKNINRKQETSIYDDDIYTTADDDMKEVKLSATDDQSVPSSTYTAELFSSTDDDGMENGVRKLPTKRPKRSFCCICQRVVTPMILLAVIIIFLIYFFGDSTKLQGLIPGTDMLFASEDLGEQYVWRRSNTDGLTLNIINALDTQWYTYFDTAVSDWDNGTPDALTLTSEVASAPDPDCTMVEGVLKMCNNNYGNTDWMGINEVLKYENELAGSIGMMNDHYFGSGDGYKRQYTMCHEMGHGFGLPHTDTTMWNRNTGNCLDYTNRPRSNTRPGQINYDRLVKVYGTVGGSNTTTTTDSSTSNPPTSVSSNGNDDDSGTSNNVSTNAPQSGGGNNGHNNNKQNSKNGNRFLSNPIDKIPQYVHDRLRQLRKEYTNVNNGPGRRRLLRNSNNNDHHYNNDHYEIDLGGGYTLDVKFLMP
jgi:hypothetical protein